LCKIDGLNVHGAVNVLHVKRNLGYKNIIIGRCLELSSMMMELLNIFRELLLLTDGTLFIQHGTFRLKSRKFCIVFFCSMGF
jgi:hypothetical protein